MAFHVRYGEADLTDYNSAKELAIRRLSKTEVLAGLGIAREN